MARDFHEPHHSIHLPHTLGRVGENEAARFLLNSGYLIIDRNWRGSYGEIDIIARSDANEIIFIEVKTRSSLRFGDPFDAITPEKYQRIFRLGREWIALHHPRTSWRIDVILLLKSNSGFELIHHKGLIA